MSLTMTLRADDPIPTRYTLLSRLQNWDDQDSWKDFFDTYWRLIYSVAIKSGLTPTEAAIAADVAAGLTLLESARQRGVRESTVRWHLKHVLAKTNVRSQTQLVRMLVRGPAALLPSK